MNSLVNLGFNQREAPRGATCQRQFLFQSRILTAGLAALLSSLPDYAVGVVFSNSPPMLAARSGQTATLLPSGKLLVAGGITNVDLTTATTELYEPSTGIWTVTGSMNADRAHHTATVLPNGQILVSGGHASGTGALSSAELYDPAL